MIEADARDDGNVGCRNDVGGVQAAAKADFQHRNLASRLGEMQERHRRHKLELRWVVTGFHRHLLGMLTYLQGDARKVGHTDVLAVHADALFEALDERAGEPAHTVAGGLQHVGDIGARAAFPVRARNMHDVQAVLGVAQARKQLTDTIEAQTRRLPTGSVDISDRIEVLRGVLRGDLRPMLRCGLHSRLRLELRRSLRRRLQMILRFDSTAGLRLGLRYGLPTGLRDWLRHTGFTLLESPLFVSRLARDDNPSPSMRRFSKPLSD